MTRKHKIILAIITPIILALLILLMAISAFDGNKAETIIYPEGNLSDSIFDSQNMEYQGNDLFTEVYSFKDIPYTIDAINADSAEIGLGSVYSVDGYYILYSEIQHDDTLQNCLIDEFSQVLEYGSNASICTLDPLVSEHGFYDGFTTDYLMGHISLPTSSGNQDAYFTAYRLYVNDSSYDYDIAIAVMTQELSTEKLSYCKQLMDANVLTMQYSTSLANELADKKNLNETEETEESETIEDSNNESTVTNISSGVSTVDDDSADSTLVNGKGDKASKSMGILLKQNYNDLTVVVNWTNAEATPQIVFSDVQGEHQFYPDTTAAGQVTFHVGEATGGVYMVMISNWEDAGVFTSELIENQEDSSDAEDTE